MWWLLLFHTSLASNNNRIIASSISFLFHRFWFLFHLAIHIPPYSFLIFKNRSMIQYKNDWHHNEVTGCSMHETVEWMDGWTNVQTTERNWLKRKTYRKIFSGFYKWMGEDEHEERSKRKRKRNSICNLFGLVKTHSIFIMFWSGRHLPMNKMDTPINSNSILA